jgi:hypothetical protein
MSSRTPHILGANHESAHLLTRSALQRRIAREPRAPPCVVDTTASAKEGCSSPLQGKVGIRVKKVVTMASRMEAVAD